MTINEILADIQQSTKAPKGQYNSFGKYAYRSAEDIMEAVKPALKKHKAVITCSDEVVEIGDRIYVKVTATISAGEESISVTACAREPETKKGMDESQITGAASSYARKYALSGLLLLDDNKDADNFKPEEPKPIPVDDSARKAAGENFKGLCSKLGLVTAYVAKSIGLKGKPTADEFNAAIAYVEQLSASGQIPIEWRPRE